MIKEFLKKYGYLYIRADFLALNSYIQSLAPDALGKAIDLLAAPSPSRDAVLRQAGIIALIGVGIFAARFIWRLFIIGNARRMEIFLREKLYLKFQAMPVNYLQSHNSGDLMAYAINDVGAVRITFGPVLAQSVNGIVIALLSIFGMARETDLGVTLLALAPVPFAAAATIILGGKVQQRFGKVQKLFSGLSGFVNESIAGIKVTKAFAKEDVREAEFGEISGKNARRERVARKRLVADFPGGDGVVRAVLRARADFRRRGGGSRENGRRLARQLPRLSDARPTADSPARHDNQPRPARTRELQAPEGGLRRTVGPGFRPGAQRERRARPCAVGRGRKRRRGV